MIPGVHEHDKKEVGPLETVYKLVPKPRPADASPVEIHVRVPYPVSERELMVRLEHAAQSIRFRDGEDAERRLLRVVEAFASRNPDFAVSVLHKAALSVDVSAGAVRKEARP